MLTSLLWHLNLLMGNLFSSHLQGKYFLSPWRWWPLNPSARVVTWPAWSSPAVPKATMGREVHGSESKSAIDLLLPTWRETQADGPKAGLAGGNLWSKRWNPLWQQSPGLGAGEGVWTAMEMEAPCTKAVLGHCWAKWGQCHQERILWQQEGNWALRMERELLGYGRSGAPWSGFQAVVLLLYTREKRNNITTHKPRACWGMGTMSRQHTQQSSGIVQMWPFQEELN